MNFKQWLNEAFGDANAFNQKFGQPDFMAGGLRAASGGGLNGDPSMVVRRNDRMILAKDLPQGATVVNVDADGELYYRMVEMPDGNYILQKATTLEDEPPYKQLPINAIRWETVKVSRDSYFPSNWMKALGHR